MRCNLHFLKQRKTNPYNGGFSLSGMCLFIFSTLLIFSSCNKKEESLVPQQMEAERIASCSITPDTLDLLVNGYIKIGTVIITNDEKNLIVTYNTSANWPLDSTHLFSGNCDVLPKDQWGNPVMSAFTHHAGHASATSYTYTIPFSGLDSCICIAAYASVQMQGADGSFIGLRTAWSSGTLINPSGENLYMYYPYCKKVCTGDTGGTDTGTGGGTGDTTGTGGTGTGTGGTGGTGDTTGTGGTGTGTGDTTGTGTDSIPCIKSGDFRTQTQGGWGSTPHGNNPGTYLHANFAAAFPNGLTVGCTYVINLTSAQAVTNFLPEGGKPRALTSDATNTSVGNVLAGQVVALTLSVTFDQYDANFGASSTSMGNLKIETGPLAGMTVNDVLAEANKILGGCSSAYSASQINDAISGINQNFVDGKANNGFLACPNN